MSYRNKTYVIFDADSDMWAYGYMLGWISREHIDFDFDNAHDLGPLTDRASDDTVFSRLRMRMANTKQVIVLVGDETRKLRKYIPWEITIAIQRDLPIVVANLNGYRRCDADRCPATLRSTHAVHVAFKMKIIKHALDYFPAQHARRTLRDRGPLSYPEDLYTTLGL